VTIHIHPYQPAWAEALETLQRRYIAEQPRGARFVPAALYQEHPAHAGGHNLPCALDAYGHLLGYGAFLPGRADLDSGPQEPDTFWIHIRVHPLAPDRDAVQEALYTAVMERCQAVAAASPDRPARVAISYPEGRQDEIAFFARHGFHQVDTLVRLWRKLERLPYPSPLPAGLTEELWLSADPADRRRYLAAERACIPHAVRSDAELAHYFSFWEGGSAVSAVDSQGNVVGNVMAYWVGPHAVTEDVLVRPGWRRQGIARHLLLRALRYLKAQGHAGASLELHESSAAALALYRSLGYEEVSREEQWELPCSE
jgi:GNAT superfamily N-acetyltransferase